jgi:hypothetical protein
MTAQRKITKTQESRKVLMTSLIVEKVRNIPRGITCITAKFEVWLKLILDIL